MSPSTFIARWKGASGTELANAQIRACFDLARADQVSRRSHRPFLRAFDAGRPVNFDANLESLGKIHRLIDGRVGG